jgi:hypothetical protein
MLDYRSTIAAAGAFMGGLLVGCGDPDLPTDLRTSGPPSVTAVMVMSDLETAIDPPDEMNGPIDRYLEDATYCRLKDDKRPGLVGLIKEGTTIQVCPDDLNTKADDDGVAQAAPPVWFVRVVFDMLLDPNVEDLQPVLDENGMPTGVNVGTLKNTQPVTLTCNGVDVAYDGYYVPNGNKQSWPLGPALFVQPLSATDVPTGAMCTVSVKDSVHNKASQSVANQRSFTFQLAPMNFRFSDPEPGNKMDGLVALDPKTPIQLFWTAELRAGATITTTDAQGMDHTIVLSDLDTTKVTLISAPNLNITATNPNGDPDPSVCQSTGSPVNSGNIRAYLAGQNATTSALVLQLDAGGDPAQPTAQMDQLWQPTTTYLLTFADGASVTPKQGGDPGPLPGAADFSLCFHTTALNN